MKVNISQKIMLISGIFLGVILFIAPTAASADYPDYYVKFMTPEGYGVPTHDPDGNLIPAFAVYTDTRVPSGHQGVTDTYPFRSANPADNATRFIQRGFDDWGNPIPNGLTRVNSYQFMGKHGREALRSRQVSLPDNTYEDRVLGASTEGEVLQASDEIPTVVVPQSNATDSEVRFWCRTGPQWTGGVIWNYKCDQFNLNDAQSNFPSPYIETVMCERINFKPRVEELAVEYPGQCVDGEEEWVGDNPEAGDGKVSIEAVYSDQDGLDQVREIGIELNATNPDNAALSSAKITCDINPKPFIESTDLTAPPPTPPDPTETQYLVEGLHIWFLLETPGPAWVDRCFDNTYTTELECTNNNRQWITNARDFAKAKIDNVRELIDQDGLTFTEASSLIKNDEELQLLINEEPEAGIGEDPNYSYDELALSEILYTNVSLQAQNDDGYLLGLKSFMAGAEIDEVSGVLLENAPNLDLNPCPLNDPQCSVGPAYYSIYKLLDKGEVGETLDNIPVDGAIDNPLTPIRCWGSDPGKMTLQFPDDSGLELPDDPATDDGKLLLGATQDPYATINPFITVEEHPEEDFLRFRVRWDVQFSGGIDGWHVELLGHVKDKYNARNSQRAENNAQGHINIDMTKPVITPEVVPSGANRIDINWTLSDAASGLKPGTFKVVEGKDAICEEPRGGLGFYDWLEYLASCGGEHTDENRQNLQPNGVGSAGAANLTDVLDEIRILPNKFDELRLDTQNAWANPANFKVTKSVEDKACNVNENIASLEDMKYAWMKTRDGNVYSSQGFNIPQDGQGGDIFSTYSVTKNASLDTLDGFQTVSEYNWINDSNADSMEARVIDEIGELISDIDVAVLDPDNLYKGVEVERVSGDLTNHNFRDNVIYLAAEENSEIILDPKSLADPQIRPLILVNGNITIKGDDNKDTNVTTIANPELLAQSLGYSPVYETTVTDSESAWTSVFRTEVMYGALIANGFIKTELDIDSADGYADQLIIKGLFVSRQQAQFLRNLGYIANQKHPAEIVIYDPAYLFEYADVFSRLIISFEESGN